MRKHAQESGVVLLAVLICCVEVGCYKHVVRTKGYGTGVDEVYEPNRDAEPDKFDEFMWGETGSKEKKRR
ncbi:MAG: hypothetical protein ACYSU7_13665 [Planctomycetota bacterium]|jgi:hypothetical protein